LFRFSFSLIVVIGMSVMILSGWDVLIRKIGSKMEENPRRTVDTRWILTITVLLFTLVIIMSFLQVTGE
jgi:Na+-driven multidrug efflux pump